MLTDTDVDFLKSQLDMTDAPVSKEFFYHTEEELKNLNESDLKRHSLLLRNELNTSLKLLKNIVDSKITENLPNEEILKNRKIFTFRIDPKKGYNIDKDFIFKFFTDFLNNLNFKIQRLLLINDYLLIKLNKNTQFPTIVGNILDRYVFIPVNPKFVLKLNN